MGNLDTILAQSILDQIRDPQTTLWRLLVLQILIYGIQTTLVSFSRIYRNRSALPQAPSPPAILLRLFLPLLVPLGSPPSDLSLQPLRLLLILPLLLVLP